MSAAAPGGDGDREPLVSVIVPAFNAAATLDETLRSALAQSLESIELIVVDDGSTDATAGIARRFAAADRRVRLVATANRGTGAARNAALALARGRFVAPLDADDLWHPQKLEKQVEAALACDRPPGFVYCFFRGIDAQGHVLPPAEALAIEGRIFFRHVYKNVVGNGSGALFLRTAMIETGGYDEERPAAAEDLRLQLKIARRYEVRVVAEYLVGYRVGAGRSSTDHDAQYRGRCRTVRAADAELGPLPPPLLRWSLGAAAGDLAGARLRAGRPLGAAGATLSALRHDPLRTALRVAEQIASRFGPAQASGRVRFADMDSRAAYAAGPSRNGWASRRLRRLDAERLRRLADFDRDL